MSNLIGMLFEGPYDAEKARLELRMMEKDELVDLGESRRSSKNHGGTEAIRRQNPL